MPPNASQCLSKITILVDLIRQRAVWSLRIKKTTARALVLRIARRRRPPVPSPSRTPPSPRSALARRRRPALCYTTVAAAAALPYPTAPPPCPRRRLPRRPPLPLAVACRGGLPALSRAAAFSSALTALRRLPHSQLRRRPHPYPRRRGSPLPTRAEQPTADSGRSSGNAGEQSLIHLFKLIGC